MDIDQLRGEINQIDEQIIRLFAQRMRVSASIARYKRENGLPIHDPAREEVVLTRASALAGDEFAQDTRALFALLFELSKGYQARLNGDD